MDDTTDDAQVMGQAQSKVFTGGLAGTAQGALLAQLDRQVDYRREQALHLALQANAGSQPYSVTQLVSDAEIILAWLAPKSN